MANCAIKATFSYTFAMFYCVIILIIFKVLSNIITFIKKLAIVEFTV